MRCHMLFNRMIRKSVHFLSNIFHLEEKLLHRVGLLDRNYDPVETGAYFIYDERGLSIRPAMQTYPKDFSSFGRSFD
ncbi:hypothetical protein BpHYR1_045667 [Brachionus plicatilis]|uniref:Uncharacterized protein n=1 Tax=Brachionus plicatilis TaxID=10195 RepID=A0A3M7PEG6_BRAPC|nr:hypothetical protein BpHYR1_045667 [Brachionus plicatilis]